MCLLFLDNFSFIFPYLFVLQLVFKRLLLLRPLPPPPEKPPPPENPPPLTLENPPLLPPLVVAILLAVLSLCIGMLWLTPYIAIAEVCFYDRIVKPSVKKIDEEVKIEE